MNIFEKLLGKEKPASNPSIIEGPKQVTREMLDELMAGGMTEEEAFKEAARRIRRGVKKETR